MSHSHVDAEEKVESAKEEVEVWIHVRFRRRCEINPAILQKYNDCSCVHSTSQSQSQCQVGGKYVPSCNHCI